MTTVVVNDFVIDRRIAVLFNPHDFKRVDTFWEQEDKILVDLQCQDSFKGHLRWCDLTPTQFRFLIMANLNRCAELSDMEQADPTNPTMASLTFLLTGFIKRLELNTESTLELMKINRLGESEVLYDYTGSINMHLDSLRPRSGLRVIVDNT